ncbi:hypothetical protein BN946_scf184354.g21 [Trametes cinnabarina]|uniref:PSP proline-rich domain-containing protein n=1 Tax=Pycnoporus cinnabarinus TaxID=5643 RepID=A0A060SCL0_PYCCI|nr:hypothetical protein BN946_scf184354.g21 [Trametes cinnabarina]
MAARSGIGRIARLNLFSGPNCSLCDIAKAELAKVRQQRPFDLETVNIQDPGQERWKRKYVYWIPALHIEGKEVAKGRWDAQTVLGAEDKVEDGITDVRRCFNCGSPDHVLSACLEPIDRALVSLTRQLFNFYRGDSGGPFQRIHEVEQWRQQRLQWLDEFEPGQIKGAVLREALGLKEGDHGEGVEWLQNMACWGYPPGWVGTRDPREHVWERLANAADEESDEEYDFTIVGDDEEEHMVLSTHGTSFHAVKVAAEDDRLEPSSKPRRWAVFPDTYFLWSKLPVYKGSSLPAVGSDVETSNPSNSVNMTFSADRQALWQSLLAGISEPVHRVNLTLGDSSTVPPWRLSGVLTIETPAPEPAGPPPPLPPSSPPPLPPHPPRDLSLSAATDSGRVAKLSSQSSLQSLTVTEDDQDMDLSD